jgi:hypothetical protein
VDTAAEGLGCQDQSLTAPKTCIRRSRESSIATTSGKGPAQSTDEVAAAKSRLTELCNFSYVPVKLKEGDQDVILFLAGNSFYVEVKVGEFTYRDYFTKM